MDENKQLALIDGESDDALFLDDADLQKATESKRYTAATVDKIRYKRELVLALLTIGLPVDSIATRAGCNSRTVNLLNAKYAQQIAQDLPAFVKALRGTAAKALAIAGTKLESAKLGELAIFIGVTTQRAGEMEAAAAAVTNENVITVDSVTPELESAREFVKRLKPVKADEPKTES